MKTTLKKIAALARNGRRYHRTHEQGAALVLGLIMLLVVTLLGVAGMRDTLLQEKMAGNMRDREVALQAAEAALRTGELVLQQASLPDFNGANGLFAMQERKISGVPVSEQKFWLEWKWDDSKSKKFTGYSTGDVFQEPRYVVEKLSTDMSAHAYPKQGGASGGSLVQALDLNSEDFIPKQDFRITAMGWGGSEDARVIVQSTYRRE